MFFQTKQIKTSKFRNISSNQETSRNLAANCNLSEYSFGSFVCRKEREKLQNGLHSRYSTSIADGCPLDMLLRAVNGHGYEEGWDKNTDLFCKYHHHVQLVDAWYWLEVPRDRVFILLVHHSLGQEVLDEAVHILQEDNCYLSQDS